jgi:hypothetical protein
MSRDDRRDDKAGVTRRDFMQRAGAAAGSAFLLPDVLMAAPFKAPVLTAPNPQPPASNTVGRWVQLTVAPHNRVVPVLYNPAATEAAPYTSQSEIPSRNFCAPVMDDEGRLHIFGSLHSDYPGNEMDLISLDQVIQADTIVPPQPKRPHVPDQANSTASASIVYVSGTQTWQSYAYHTYGRASWHPVHGYFGANLTGVIGWSGQTPTYTPKNGAGGASAVIAWNESNNNWSVVDPAWVGPTGTVCAGEYDTFNEVVPLFYPTGGTCYVAEVGNVGQYHPFTEQTRTRAITYAGNTLTPFTTNIAMTAENNNGHPSHYLDYGRHIVICLPYPTNGAARAFIWDHYAKTSSEVSLPSALAECPQGQAYNDLYCAIDRGRRHIYWGKVVGTTLNIYRASFDNPGAIGSVLTSAPLPETYANRCVKPLWFWKDSLFLVVPQNAYPGKTYFWRYRIGEYTAPAVTIEKRTTSVVSSDSYAYPLWKGKHFNHAVASDGNVYSIGGDLSESSNQRMFKYAPSTGLWIQILDYACDGRLTGAIRPSQPDDGAWFWDAGIARFWWLPGGGQLAYGGQISRYNICPTEGLFTSGTAYTKDQINATRWKCYEMMTYDPATGAWAVQSFANHPTYKVYSDAYVTGMNIYGADNASRGNAFDPTARRIYRFVTGARMAAFDLASGLVETYWCHIKPDGSVWSAYSDNYMDSLAYSHQSMCVNPADGYIYGVISATGELFRINGRGTPVRHDSSPGVGSYRLPVEPLANRIPARLAWNRVNDTTNISGADKYYLRIWKGGLLFYWGLTTAASKVQGAYWRSFTNVSTSEWIPVPIPADFRGGPMTTNSFPDGSFLVAGNDYGSGNFYIVR